MKITHVDLLFILRADLTSALTALERALILAEPEGYVRLFVDEGAPMAALLRAAEQHSLVPASVAWLLAAFPDVGLEARPEIQNRVPFGRIQNPKSG